MLYISMAHVRPMTPPFLYAWWMSVINPHTPIRGTSIESSTHHFSLMLSADWNHYVTGNFSAIPIARCLFGQEEGSRLHRGSLLMSY